MQLTLFPLDPRPLQWEIGPPPPAADLPGAPAAPEEVARQLPLFSVWTELMTRQLDRALAEADFAAAREICARMEAAYGSGSVPPWAPSLEEVAADLGPGRAARGVAAH